MRVPFHDMSREATQFRAEFQAVFDRVLASGRYLFGHELEQFEAALAQWHGVRFAIGVASGTDALEIALRALELDRDTVSTTALTAVPTINAIEAAGLNATLVDIDPVSYNAIGVEVHVHLYGLATDARTSLVEDVAHSMGSRVDGRLAGTMAKAAALSFYPSKILGAMGDGGAILTNDPAIAVRAKEISFYGFNADRNDVSRRGQNSRLPELQAGFLLAKLDSVAGFIDARRRIAAKYNSELGGRVITPVEPAGSTHVYHCYAVQCAERTRLRAALSMSGIDTMVHYDHALHQYGRWKTLGVGHALPVAESLAASVLSLPCYPLLREDEQDAVIAAIKSAT